MWVSIKHLCPCVRIKIRIVIEEWVGFETMSRKTKKQNVVYYGEYSLDLWIKMMLSGKISLPPYQRYFVWTEQQSKQLMDAFEEDRFVPPVTIAEFEENEEKKDYIIDGQQRLTSILLSYLGMSFAPEQFDNPSEGFVNENDDVPDDTEYNAKEWKYDLLFKDCERDRDSIREKFIGHGYKATEKCYDSSFFQSKFLGFCYLIPAGEEHRERYYAKIFKELNMSGTPLTERESREALYYLNSSLKGFLDPDFARAVVIQKVTGNMTYRMDFVRYLSLIANYIAVGKRVDNVAKSFTSARMPVYYEDYICSVANDEDDIKFGKFTQLFPREVYKPRLDKLKRCCESFLHGKVLTSIIELDIYCFGMIYWILYKGEELKNGYEVVLSETLEGAINLCKDDARHKKSPAALKFVRERMAVSIEKWKTAING